MKSHLFPSAGTAVPGRVRPIKRLVCLTATLLLLLPASAMALEKITFTWRANPPQEGVLGYRIYYGTSSRFTSTGQLKANFSYDYYVDVFQSERCPASEPVPQCENLDLSELRCDNLTGDTPRCTIFNLPGQEYYFAMTAYNAEAESGFTPELSTANPTKGWSTIQFIAPLLLHKKK